MKREKTKHLDGQPTWSDPSMNLHMILPTRSSTVEGVCLLSCVVSSHIVAVDMDAIGLLDLAVENNIK